MTPTVRTLFSGGEVGGEGMRAAGYEHAGGIELDDAIAQNARDNGFPVQTADILTVDPRQLAPTDALHASPPCTRASGANQSAELNDDGTKEAPLDVAFGEKIAAFIDALQPGIFTLENVYAYRKFKAFGIVTAALTRNGYFWDYDNLNSADFGVPQTRRRFILRAVRGRLLPNLPPPVPWVGWYAAIEDLIPTLPASRFAPWQLARLPEELTGTFYTIPQQSDDYKGTEFGYGCPRRSPNEPALTVTATQRPAWYKAFIVSNAKTEWGDGVRGAADPVQAVTGESKGRVKAFIVDCQDSAAEGGLTVRQSADPMFTVSASMHPRRPARAFLVGGANTSEEQAGPGVGVSADDEPTRAVNGSNALHWRAWLSAGRVVSMTPRALARFQSCPDSHTLPEKASLATKIVGNGWPSLMAQRIYEGLRP